MTITNNNDNDNISSSFFVRYMDGMILSSEKEW